MSKTIDKAVEYVRGTKRLAIIQKWLPGQDDPEYDVLPTHKEGKYIVKRREKSDKDKSNDKSDSKDNTKTKADKSDSKSKAEELKENDELDDKELEEDDKESDDELEYEEMKHRHNYMNYRYSYTNDLNYINYQILLELRQINEYIKRERE